MQNMESSCYMRRFDLTGEDVLHGVLMEWVEFFLWETKHQKPEYILHAFF